VAAGAMSGPSAPRIGRFYDSPPRAERQEGSRRPSESVRLEGRRPHHKRKREERERKGRKRTTMASAASPVAESNSSRFLPSRAHGKGGKEEGKKETHGVWSTTIPSRLADKEKEKKGGEERESPTRDGNARARRQSRHRQKGKGKGERKERVSNVQGRTTHAGWRPIFPNAATIGYRHGKKRRKERGIPEPGESELDPRSTIPTIKGKEGWGGGGGGRPHGGRAWLQVGCDITKLEKKKKKGKREKRRSAQLEGLSEASGIGLSNAPYHRKKKKKREEKEKKGKRGKKKDIGSPQVTP